MFALEALVSVTAARGRDTVYYEEIVIIRSHKDWASNTQKKLLRKSTLLTHSKRVLN